jgi:SAM-dependent methyltransferase
MDSIKAVIKNIPGISWLQGGWPDEARFIVQAPALNRTLWGHQLEGACLNVGSGEGLYAQFLEDFSSLRRIAHMDVQMPNIASRFANGRHEEFVGSVTALPFDTGEFDVCLCTEVMEHVVEHDKGFAELARVLKPGGLLLISTPTPPAPFDPAHVREGYTLEDMRGHLERNGFKILNHTFCFHLALRMLLVIWRWQFEKLGGAKRSFMPRFLIYFAGLFDRFIPVGKPWDIVVLARRQLSGAENFYESQARLSH